MTRVFVGNLSFEVTQSDLREAFAAYGPVTSADIVMDRSNGVSRARPRGATMAAGGIRRAVGTSSALGR
jgi:hypothetical protein